MRGQLYNFQQGVIARSPKSLGLTCPTLGFWHWKLQQKITRQIFRVLRQKKSAPLSIETIQLIELIALSFIEQGGIFKFNDFIATS